MSTTVSAPQWLRDVRARVFSHLNGTDFGPKSLGLQLQEKAWFALEGQTVLEVRPKTYPIHDEETFDDLKVDLQKLALVFDHQTIDTMKCDADSVTIVGDFDEHPLYLQIGWTPPTPDAYSMLESEAHVEFYQF